MRWMLVSIWLVSAAPPPPPLVPCVCASVRFSRRQADSLLVAARRAADQWLRHDFAGLVGTGSAVMVHLPGAEPSSALRPTQAAELLRAFAEGAREIEVTILVARNVEPDRAYVEAQRVYEARGTDLRRSQALYFGFRRTPTGYRLVEIRALP